MAQVTVSVIKADVGSPGGHTKPSLAMLELARNRVAQAVSDELLLDGRVTYTGDDTALTMVHFQGTSSSEVHGFAWDTFKVMTTIAQQQGLYAAGQDLLVDAPSGNVRGAGPGVAELSFELCPKHRPAEAFMVFTADKCGPGMFNLPLYLAFASPMHNTGLLLSPDLYKGFVVTVIDMDHTEGDRIIQLSLPEEHLLLAALLRNPDRYAIETIHSRAYPDEQIVSVAATRLHNIAGKYTGKDDPAAIVRVQKIFPAPEEILHPWMMMDQIVTGDCRGAHNIPIMPMPINTAVTGAYCHPVVSTVGYSLNAQGRLSEMIDFFDNPAWDYVRLRNQEYASIFRRQGFFGVGLAAAPEIAYTGMVELDKLMAERFALRGSNGHEEVHNTTLALVSA